MKRSIALFVLFLLMIELLIVPFPRVSAEKVVEIEVHARQFEYYPNTITVQQGDRVRIKLVSEDVTHGFYIDGYDIKVTDQPKDMQDNYLEFVADKAGNFTYRCTVVCGPMHAFMLGTLVVEPSPAFPVSLVLTVIIGLVSLFFIYRKGDQLVKNIKTIKQPIDLNKKFPIIDALLKQRWVIYVILAVNLFFFTIVIFAGFAGTSVGNANFSIIFVWILWWALLIMLLLPLTGRFWCTICPIPAPGEWLDRRAFIDKGCERPPSVAIKAWPKNLKNIWLQNWSFLAVALFSGIILTRPLATSIVLSIFIVIAIWASLKFGKRIFCRYMCPVGGFIGLYSLVAPLGLRVRDKGVCRAHKDKECIVGNEQGYGCPWTETPWNIDRNAYCGLCMECVKSCSQNNITLQWQSFGADLLVDKGKKLDEAYKGFIMLTCALVYSVVFMGHWGIFKTWANMEMPGFFIYAALFLLANLVIVPILFSMSVWVGKGLADKKFPSIAVVFEPLKEMAIATKNMVLFFKKEKPVTDSPAAETAATSDANAEEKKSFMKMFVDLSYVLVPMGLVCWFAFCVSILFINGIYILHVLSDPFGWGWNLFGWKSLTWKPLGSTIYPFIQGFTLLAGLFYSIWIGAKLLAKYPLDNSQRIKLLAPVSVFLMVVTALFFWIYI